MNQHEAARVSWQTAKYPPGTCHLQAREPDVSSLLGSLRQKVMHKARVGAAVFLWWVDLSYLYFCIKKRFNCFEVNSFLWYSGCLWLFLFIVVSHVPPSVGPKKPSKKPGAAHRSAALRRQRGRLGRAGLDGAAAVGGTNSKRWGSFGGRLRFLPFGRVVGNQGRKRDKRGQKGLIWFVG